MIKLPYTTVISRGFKTAVDTLNNTAGLEAHTAYRVNRIKIALDSAFKEAGTFEMELAKSKVKRDEKGNVVYGPDGGMDFGSEEAVKKFDEEMKAYMAGKEFEVKVNKIDFNAIAHLQGLTPAVIGGLEPILENVPADE